MVYVVNYDISRHLKQLLLNLVLVQVVSSVVALLFFFSNRHETSIWIDCCQIIYRHSQSLRGFHRKTAFRRYTLSRSSWSMICTWHLIYSSLKDIAQNCSQQLFNKLFSDYNKESLIKSPVLRFLRQHSSYQNKGYLKDHNYLWDETSIK